MGEAVRSAPAPEIRGRVTGISKQGGVFVDIGARLRRLRASAEVREGAGDSDCCTSTINLRCDNNSHNVLMIVTTLNNYNNTTSRWASQWGLGHGNNKSNYNVSMYVRRHRRAAQDGGARGTGSWDLDELMNYTLQ